MNWKTTGILLLVVVALGLYIKFYESKRPGTYDAEKRAQNVINIDRDKIDGILIQNGDDKIDLRRRDQKWRLETPVKDQADNLVVDNLLSDLETWQKQTTIPGKEIDADKGRLAEFGLNKPKLRLKLSGQGAPPEIWFGKDAALEGKMYVRFENSKDTFLVPPTIGFGLRNLADWPGGVRELSRVLNRTGRLLVLEFSLPTNAVLRKGYRTYLHKCLPVIGAAITGHRGAYDYLGDSIEEFPSGQRMIELLEANGFRNATAKALTGGIVSIYTAEKL